MINKQASSDLKIKAIKYYYKINNYSTVCKIINISFVNCLGKFDEGSIPELDEQIMNFVFLHK